MNANAATPAEITAHEWAWVRALIQDVMREREREDFVTAYAEWNLAIRQFRKIEDERIIFSEPTPEDWQEYDACLDGLLQQGRKLVAQSRSLSDQELTAVNVRRENVEAGLWMIEREWRIRHEPVPEAELAEARRRVFGAEA